jgi:hypothetical protein
MTASLFRFLRAVAMVAVLTMCSPALAQLQLDVPAGCRDDANALVGNAFPDGFPDADASLSVEVLGRRHRATVRTPLGTRTLEGESCVAAVSAGLVFVALSFTAEHTLAAGRPGATHARARMLTAPGEAVQSERDEPASRPRKPLVMRANAVGLWGTGALPGGGPGGAITASLGRGWGHGTAGLTGWGPREASASVANTGGRFWLWAGLAAGCVARPSGRLRPGACLGVALGRMHGEGQGVKQSEHARALWAAALAQLELRLQVVGGLQLLAQAQPELALVRRRFRLDGAGVVHQPRALSLSAGLGAAYEFSWFH